MPNLTNVNKHKNLRKKLFIPRNEILTLINLNRKNNFIKGYDILNDILLKLDETNKIFYFIVFGNGTEILKYNSYKNLIFYNFNVDFLKMSEIYSIADLTLLPSRQETFLKLYLRVFVLMYQ